MKDTLSVYIGRFSPFHNGHAEVLLRALKKSKKVLVIIGSAEQPRRVKNPWHANERGSIITSWYVEEFAKDSSLGELAIEFNRDYMYNDNKWLAATQNIITKHNPGNDVVTITGADRDRSSFYLKKFPAPLYKLDLTEQNERVSLFLTATSIREIYFGRTFNGTALDAGKMDLLLKSFLPPTTLSYMINFIKTDAYENLVGEYNEIIKRKDAKKVFPYAIKDQTVDACVIQSGHVILIQRKNYPGKGLWALPGGHLEEYEWMLDGAIRELREETKLKVPEPVLVGSLQFDLRFEHPDRSEVGRVITQTFCFKLPDYLIDGQVTLPEIKGSDDAAKAKWIPISQALNMSDQMFDDHFAMLETCIDKLTDNKSNKRKD